MKWLTKWWFLVVVALAITYLIGRREERYQAQADQCRAAYKAQAQSERIGTTGLTVDQHASEDEAITAACEPSSYFYRLFSAANLPTVFLVFIGIGGIWAALRTLTAIERQGKIMEDNISLLISEKRMRITVQVMPLCLPPAQEGAEYEDCAISYALRYKGHSDAVVLESFVEGKITDSAEPPYQKAFIPWLLPPGSVIEPSVEPTEGQCALYGLSRLQVEMIENRKSFVHFWGFIRYRDFSERERETTFCYTWIPRPLGRAIGLKGWRESGPPEANRQT